MQTSGKPAARVPAEEVLAIWAEYRRSGDRRERDRLIFMFMPMVRYIVYRKVREVPAQCEVQDFLSCGLEALIRSIDRYDPDKGATLEQYAWTRIHGAVLDELRRHDWAPRSLRRDERAINGARERFISLHERQPSREELAELVGMSPQELTERLDQVALAEVGSLNRTVRSDGSATIERIDTIESSDGDCDPVLSAERQRSQGSASARAFAHLSKQEREVAVLLYVQDCTLREIGERLGVSESRVCQIHTPAAPATLRTALRRAGAVQRARLSAQDLARFGSNYPGGHGPRPARSPRRAWWPSRLTRSQLANDLANASTPGLQARRDAPAQLRRSAAGQHARARPVGSVIQGVALGKTFTNLNPGGLQETGEPLDFAIEGSGFFAVQTAQGVRYTRDGQFTTSATGLLTDANGNPVLGQGGAPIKVPARRPRAGLRARRLRTHRCRQAGRKPVHRHERRQGDRHGAPGRPGGLSAWMPRR